MDQVTALLPFLEMRVDRATALDNMQADLDDDGGLTRSEFVEMCTVVLAKVPLDRLAMAAENYKNACNAEEAFHRARWKRVSLVIESYAGILIPMAYFIALVHLFSATYHDKYSSGEYHPLYQGLPEGTVKSNGVGTTVIVLFTLALISLKAFYDWRKAGQTPMNRVMSAVRKEVSCNAFYTRLAALALGAVSLALRTWPGATAQDARAGAHGRSHAPPLEP